MSHEHRKSLVAALLYAPFLLAGLYPQSLRPWDTVAYIGDSLDTAYFMSWNAHQLFRDPLHLFDANILYPQRGAMALAGHRILLGILTAPVTWASDNPILAYNVAVALGYFLAAFAGRRVAAALGLSAVGAWAAGALYAFNTYQLNEAPRADLLYHGFTALATVELVRLFQTGAWRHAWTLAGLMLLQGLAANYLLVYGVLLLGLLVLLAAVASPRRVARVLPRLALAGLLAGIAFLPVILPHLRAAKTLGFAREVPEGIDLEHYVSTTPTNLIYGEIGAKVRPQQRGPHFIGFVSLGLCALAMATHRSRAANDAPGSLLEARAWVPAAAGLAALLIVLSLGRDLVAFGHELGPGPYRLLHAWAPGFAYMRIPERLGLLAMLFVALLAGQALTMLGRLGYAKAALVLGVLVPLEHTSTLPLSERVPVGADVPAVYRWLARNPVQAIAEVPIRGEGLIRKETLEEYFSAYHFRPMIAGYVSYPPLLTTLLRRMADQFPSEDSLQALQRAGVDTVVVHHGRGRAGPLPAALTKAAAEQRIALRARFDGPSARLYESTSDEVYAIRPAPPVSPAPLPRGGRLRDPSWRYFAKSGQPSLAADGDMATAWYVPGELKGDEYLEVTFGRCQALAGVVIPLRRDSAFPTLLRIEGLERNSEWTRQGRLDGPRVMQLIDQLLVHPGSASLGFDLGGRELCGVRLLVGEGATGFDGWNIQEFEILVP